MSVVNIKKIYKRNIIDAMMFGYINALKFNLPTVSVEKAIMNFMKHHNLTEDDLNIESARNIYNRMQNEYIEASKEG